MMRMRTISARILAAAGLTVVFCSSQALATSVDFDGLPVGTVVTTQYADLGGVGQGVVFGPVPGGLPEGLHPVVRVPPAGQAQSGAQVADIATCVGCEFFTPRTTGTFAVPRSSVSVRVGFLGTPGICVAIVTPNQACAEPVLRAYDASGQVVTASTPLFVQRGSGVHTQISVSTPTASIVAFEIAGSSTRDPTKQIAIDDLTFDVPATPPPPDFTLTTPTHTIAVPQGSGTNVSVAIGRIGGSAGGVAFSLGRPLPPGLHAQVSPNPADGTTATLALSADADAPLTTTTPLQIELVGAPTSPSAGPGPRPLALAVVITRDCAGVSTREQLVDAVNSGRKCIVVRSDAQIDLASGPPISTSPDDALLHIPDGVSLESGRSSTNFGGLLFMSRKLAGKQTMLDLGANTRVTGLRLRGYRQTDTLDRQDRTTAIRIRGVQDVSVDNNEIFGWPNAGVEITEVPTTRTTANRIRITRNYIHNNVQCGSGYGVVIGTTGFARIDRNVFNFNRHDVADDGKPGTGYIADLNFILTSGPTCGGFYNQHFDMHGTVVNGRSHDGGTAGDYMAIRRNTIRGDQSYGFLDRNTRPAFELRGTPTDKAVFSDNVMVHEDEQAAIRVKGVPRPSGGFVSGATYLKLTRKLIARNNRYGVDTSGRLAVGDFDGDGRADVFQSVGTMWVYSPAGRREWQFLNASGLGLDKLAFGDFDGDGKTDVFSQSGSQWRVSSGGTTPLRLLPTGSNIPMSSYRFADFDGDHKTDVFRANGSRFFISSGGATAWRALAASNLPVTKLRFGDFDGDGTTDVFSLANNQWSVSYGGTSQWRRLNARRSGNLGELVFADFDGDGRTDIARSRSGTWEISVAGTTPWQTLRSGSQPSLASMLLGDFTGDKRSDVLQVGKLNATRFSPFDRYRLSNAGMSPLTLWSAEDLH